jgi:hypothetical protein
MTVEHTTLVTADELEKIVFVCTNPACKAAVAVLIKAEMEPVWVCPVCSVNWFRDKKESVDGFRALVKALVELKRTDAPFKLHLQLKKPPSSASDKLAASS